MARSRWRTAAILRRARLESYEIDAVAPSDERLTIDIAIFGNPSARKTLVISSGLHGVEGLFGSAVQLAMIEEYLANQQLSSDLAIVMVHMLNPFGCAWYRRWNEENIDLNRNFLVGDEVYQGCPPAYSSLDSFLNPRSSPSKLEPFLLKSLGLIGRYGMSTLKSTLPVGQYDFPKGLFFGGNEPSQTQKILTTHIRTWLGAAQQVIHLDLHSGLGKWGTYRLFAELTQAAPRYQWLSEHFVDEASPWESRILTVDPDDLVYQPRGTFGRWCQSEFTDRRYDFLLAEFGIELCGHLDGLSLVDGGRAVGEIAEIYRVRAETILNELAAAYLPVKEPVLADELWAHLYPQAFILRDEHLYLEALVTS